MCFTKWLCVMGLCVWCAGAAAADGLTLLADFETGHTHPFQGGVVEAQPGLSGAGALRVDGGVFYIDRAMDWSAYDFLHVDVLNPGEHPVTLWIEVRDAQTQGYWTRVNLSTLAPPGRSVISLPVDMYVGEKARPGRRLLKDQITRLALNVGEGGPLYFDDFRLETLDASAFQFPGLVAIDFGPAGAPVLEGFAAMADQPWDEQAGLGWVNARIWRAVNALQPEPLTQDFVCPESGRFRLRLSNGIYRVGFNIHSPKGYWGEAQAYRTRQVMVNGQAAVADDQSFPQYLARHFQHADREDLPGVSAFGHYVQEQLAETWVTSEVTNGFLELAFDGEAWALCLTHLVVYPAAQDEAGHRFRDWVLERRRFHFENYFKMVPPTRVGAAAPAEGYRLFHRHFMDQVGPADGPEEGQELGAEAVLAAQAARGEEVALTVSVQPAAGMPGPAVALATDAFTSAEGNVLDSASLQFGWVDYRLARVTMDGSIYDVRPRYWRTGEAPPAPGLTRRYWLRWQPGLQLPAGVYTGKVVLTASDGSVRVLPVALEALPIRLAPVDDLPVGPWGSGIGMGWFGDEPDTQAWNDDMFAKAAEALRRHGFTSLSGRPYLHIRYGDGSFEIDFRRADREMALLKSKGFRHLISSYGIQDVGYNLYQGPSPEQVRQAGYTNAVEFLAEFYRRIEAHSIEQGWLPVAWNLCDEPIGGDIPPAVSNALLHRAAAGGLARNTFMGATSMQGDDPADTHYALVQALPMPTLTIHDAAAIAVAQAAGNQFAYYNSGDRWTYGRYLMMLAEKHALKLRLNWHYNVAVGDPYYALDCREDDYCWYNTNARGELIPSLSLLQEMVPGLNDYRYLLTLEQALAAAGTAAPAAVRAGQEILDAVRALRAGPDAREGSARLKNRNFQLYDAERERVITAILNLTKFP